MGLWLRLALAGVLLLGVPDSAWSQGEHGRRAAAELLVLQGDLARLVDGGLSEQHRAGLRARIAGGLSGLGLLLRLADQERGRQGGPVPLTELRRLFRQLAYRQLQQSLAGLIERYPLAMTGLLPIDPDPQRLVRAASIHQRLCAACHDHPNLATERPARNLFEQARRMSLLEFTARLLVGVRGDRVTGIDNPFTDTELNALLSYYLVADVPAG